jgi:hypothetical protein
LVNTWSAGLHRPHGGEAGGEVAGEGHAFFFVLAVQTPFDGLHQGLQGNRAGVEGVCPGFHAAQFLEVITRRCKRAGFTVVICW